MYYYQSLHDKHQQNIKKGNKLYFISNSYGKGNCSQVYSIVKAIRKSGNQTAFGIVDWDLTNKVENNIFVHGENERYSVENFILDPIYIVCLLIELNNAHNVCENIGIDKARLHRIHPDTELRQIGGGAFGQMQHPCLGDGIGRDCRRGAIGHHREPLNQRKGRAHCHVSICRICAALSGPSRCARNFAACSLDNCRNQS